MKAIMVMFDSLNRNMLPPYSCGWVHAPNFQRLSDRAVTFDSCYVGSMPCMPARRELHTGRYNFLHRSWGPLEPFDDSMPEILKRNGVHTHLVSDHGHYWEDGGCTYHSRYSTWEISRGQEGDLWKGVLGEIAIPPHLGGRDGAWGRQDWVNRTFLRREEDLPQAVTFANGLEFLRTNARADGWFLQIETFDPHEPFYTLERYKRLYPHDYNGPLFDWPDYGRVRESGTQIGHCRNEYAALISMCDHYLGKVLDAMDELDLWRDTMLIVNTDHGFLLGEHEWWGKCIMPFYEEIAHIPLFIWDPRAAAAGVRSSVLVQTIDLAPTLLDFFGLEIPRDMQGQSLGETAARDVPVREAALFGIHGGHVNCTDGRYVYMRAPCPGNIPLYDYTLMPTHMRSMFSVEELRGADLAEPFGFTKGCRPLRVPVGAWQNSQAFETLLFDIATDPGQERPVHDQAVEERMTDLLIGLMRKNQAPEEQYERLGLTSGVMR